MYYNEFGKPRVAPVALYHPPQPKKGRQDPCSGATVLSNRSKVPQAHNLQRDTSDPRENALNSLRARLRHEGPVESGSTLGG